MIQELTFRVLPEVAVNEQRLKEFLAREKGIVPKELTAIRILKRSIDARQRTIFIQLEVRLYINEEPEEERSPKINYPNVEGKRQVIVVGAGPGGLFAALRLIELGLKPIVIERGKNVHERKKDLARIGREQQVNPESNYSFGEGGAGAYSDGKLYTRSKKRGDTEKILNVFCQHGASSAILVDAHPHIGTDKLPRVIENMRNTILRCGGEVHFETRMDSLLIRKDSVIGIKTHRGEEFMGAVILAIGHSARDVYRWLVTNGVETEPKNIAVGVRLEHPSELIDCIQYHNPQGRGKYLPAAEYSFVTQVAGRGVYSFCMCPGGFVIPAATNFGQIVVNGMSSSNRNSRWSNAGMVVELSLEELQKNKALTKELDAMRAEEAKFSSLRMMHFQEYLEGVCWRNGNCKQTAPAQRMADFCNRKPSVNLPKSSYVPGLISSPLHTWLPPFITDRLIEGFRHFGKKSPGFLTNEALLIGVETRTSAPIRILREKERLQHIRLKGLFPCGEGAGYAGGIVSAAVDGERCAEAVKKYLDQRVARVM